MLHLRDISLRHRLLIANFTMVFVPIFILTVLGFLLVSGLRFSSPHNDLTTLWPEKGRPFPSNIRSVPSVSKPSGRGR